MHIAFSRHVTADELTAMYDEVYHGAPFVRVLPAGELPEMKSVVNTPRAEIGFQILTGGRRAVVVSVIDNLLKGAASQAIQNFNRMFGYDEKEGLM
jgi:N-acetyl-gamma-glutamyl-phosphate reductase